MPGNQVELDLSLDNANRKLDALTERIARLRAELTQLGNVIGQGGASPQQLGEYRSGLAQLYSLQTGAASLQTSTSMGSSGGSTTASTIAGAAAAMNPFTPVRGQKFGDPVAAFSAMQQLLPGLSSGALYAVGSMMNNGGMPFASGTNVNAAQAAVNVVQSAQAAASGGGGGAGLPPYSGRVFYGGPGGGPFSMGIAQNDPTLQFTRTMVMPSAVPAAPGLPAGYQSSGPWAPGQLAGSGGQTMMIPAMAGNWNGWAPFAGYGVGAYGGGPTDRLAAFAGSPFGRGIGVAAGAGILAGLSVSAGETVSGRRDIMGEAGALGALIGGLIGAPAGPMAAGVGAGIGSSVMSWLAAPMERAAQVEAGILGVQGTFGGSRGNKIRWATELSSELSGRWSFGGRPVEISAQALGAIYTSAANALFTGGLDPLSGAASVPGGFRSTADPSRGLVFNAAAAAKDVINASITEGAAARIARRVGALYPESGAAVEVMNRIAPIYGARPETGGNFADILTRFGPLASYQYLQSQVEPGVITSLSRDEVMAASANIRSAQRSARLGALQVRGSGRAAMEADITEMGYIAGLPGGRDSESYAESRARMRRDRSLMYEQQDITAFDIPGVQLQGLRERANMGPFAPGNRYAIELASMSLNARHIDTLRARMSDLRRRGELSERDELAMSSQIEQLLTQNAAGVAMLSEGVENRLPALAAGTPSGFRRFDSMQLAALNLLAIGSPMRRYGAINGRQASMQEQFVNSFGTGSMNPRSRTWDMNNGDVVGVLNEIAGILRSMAGGRSNRMNRGDRDLPPSGGQTPGGYDAQWN